MASLVDSPRSPVSTMGTRDTQDSDNNQVPVAGIVIGSVIGLILVICILAYCLSADNFFRRRSWFKKGPQLLRNKDKSQHLSPPDDEEALTKRASFVSERESIMFSRSRASSLQFAVVEGMDSQRRMSSQVYVLRGEQYVPLQHIDTERNSLLGRDTRRTSEADISSTDNYQFSHSSIPVVVTPPPENTERNQHYEDVSRNVSRTGSIDHSDAVSEVSAPLTHTSR